MSRIDNSFQFIGNLGTDVEVRKMTNGNSVATLNIAVDNSYKDADGERIKRTSWFEGTIYSPGLIEICHRWLATGSLIAIVGHVEKRVWESKDRRDADGRALKDSKIEFVVSSVKFLGNLRNVSGEPPSEAMVSEGQEQNHERSFADA